MVWLFRTFGPVVYRTELALALGLSMCPVNMFTLFMTEFGRTRGPESTSIAITGPLALPVIVESVLSSVPRLLSSLSAVAEYALLASRIALFIMVITKLVRCVPVMVLLSTLRLTVVEILTPGWGRLLGHSLLVGLAIRLMTPVLCEQIIL